MVKTYGKQIILTTKKPIKDLGFSGVGCPANHTASVGMSAPPRFSEPPWRTAERPRRASSGHTIFIRSVRCVRQKVQSTNKEGRVAQRQWRAAQTNSKLLRLNGDVWKSQWWDWTGAQLLLIETAAAVAGLHSWCYKWVIKAPSRGTLTFQDQFWINC